MVNACQNKTDRKSEWIKGLIARRNKNIATVALANKNASIIWAVLSRGDDYRRGGDVAGHRFKPCDDDRGVG